MNLLYIILCILGIAAAIPETISYRYSDLGMLDRDGGTAIDSFNLLRCLQLFNVTNGTYAAVNSDEQLVIVNVNGFVNHTKLKEDLGKCYSNMGAALAIELVNGVDIYDNGYERIDLSKRLNKNQVSKFANVARNVMTGMSHNETSAFDKESGIMDTLGGLQARSKYLAYYSMRVTLSRNNCNSNEEVDPVPSPLLRGLESRGAFAASEVITAKEYSQRRLAASCGWDKKEACSK